MKQSPITAGAAIGWTTLGMLTLVISYITDDYRNNLLGMGIVWIFYKIILDAVSAIQYLQTIDKPEPPPVPKREPRRSSYPPDRW